MARDIDTIKLVIGAEDNASSVLGKVSKALGGISSIIATIGLEETLRRSVKVASEFEAELANVSTLVDTSKVSIKGLKKGIEELDPALGSATELTKGLYQAISAGIEPAKAVEFVGEAAKFAKAGLTDTFTAVDVLTTSLEVYGKTAVDASSFSDILFKTVEQGKTTVEELSNSIGLVLPVAQTLGVSFEDVNTVMATLTKTFPSTSQAATALRGIFADLLKPTDQAKEAAKALGISFDETSLKTLGIVGFLEQFRGRADLTKEDLGKLFGRVESLNAVLALTGSSFDTLVKVQSEMQGASGATETAFSKQRETMRASLTVISNSIEKVGIALGDILLPKITPFVEGLSKIISNNKELIATKFDSFIEGVSSAFSILADVTIKTRKAFKNFSDSKAFELISDGFKILTDTATNTITFFSNLSSKLFDFTLDIISNISNLLSSLQNKEIDFKDLGFTLISSLGNAISDAVSTVLKVSINFAIDTIKYIVTWVTDNKEDIKSVGRNLIEFISGAIDAALIFLKDSISSVIDTMTIPVKWAVENAQQIKDSGKAIVSFISEGMSGAINTAGKAANDIAQKISDFFPQSPAKEGPLRELSRQGEEIISQLSQGMEDNKSEIIDKAGDVAGETISKIKDTVSEKEGELKTSFSTALSNAASGLIKEIGFIDSLRGLGTSLTQELAKGIVKGEADFKSIMENFFINTIAKTLDYVLFGSDKSGFSGGIVGGILNTLFGAFGGGKAGGGAGTAATSAPGLFGIGLQDVVAGGLVVGAGALFVNEFMSSQDRRTALADLERHKKRASEAYSKFGDVIGSSITGQVGGVSSIGNILENIFDSPMANIQKAYGIDLESLLTDLLFKGKVDLKPVHGGAVRTITSDEFFGAAPQEFMDAVNTFYQSPAFAQAAQTFNQLLEIVSQLYSGIDIGKPELVRHILETPIEELTEDVSGRIFGNTVINVNIENANVRSDEDIDNIAAKIAFDIETRINQPIASS